jgi:O-acetyl-ADP-ribose deacetylase (regulator of RNase III)
MDPTNLSAQVVDITTLAVDAIINAANEQLAPGGGVCGAIHCAAGPARAQACAKIGHCPTGEARVTPGFNLPALFVIHAVGPIWHRGNFGEAEQLANAYLNDISWETEVWVADASSHLIHFNGERLLGPYDELRRQRLTDYGPC